MYRLSLDAISRTALPVGYPPPSTSTGTIFRSTHFMKVGLSSCSRGNACTTLLFTCVFVMERRNSTFLTRPSRFSILLTFALGTAENGLLPTTTHSLNGRLREPLGLHFRRKLGTSLVGLNVLVEGSAELPAEPKGNNTNYMPTFHFTDHTQPGNRVDRYFACFSLGLAKSEQADMALAMSPLG